MSEDTVAPYGNTMETVENYLKLLLAFQALPKSHRGRTFMEVSGYPHYENVCSNILAFYFNPDEEHGLKNLLLTAFFQMCGNRQVPASSEVTVYREYPTGTGGFIDLIIDSEEFTVGIENKIYHHLYNDLEDYGKELDQRGQGKNLTIKAVLGLRPIRESLQGGFTSHSYPQLWRCVKACLGAYVAEANPKWLTYLIDFMETTNNLAGQNVEARRADQFFIEHHDDIDRLVNERNAFLGRLNQEVATLMTLMQEIAGSYPEMSKLPWIYKKNILVLDFRFKESFQISFDFYLTPRGWELCLFGRDDKSSRYLQQLFAHPAMQARFAEAQIKGNESILQTWPVFKPLEELQEALRSWMDPLVQAANANPN